MGKLKNPGFFSSGNSGFSLLEFLVSIGVVGFLVTGISTFVVNKSDQKVRIAYAAARDSIYNKATSLISNRQALKEVAKSGVFRSCWNSDGTCSQTNPNNPGKDLELLYSKDSTNVLVGSKDNPAVYNRWGVNCGTKSAPRTSTGCTTGRHIWEAYSEYWFSCPNQSPSCAKPVSANLRVFVNLNPKLKSALPPQWSPFGNSQPAERQPQFWTNLLLQDNQRITTYTDSGCGSEGAYQEGLSEEGKPICKCLPTHDEIGKTSSGEPKCQIKDCIDADKKNHTTNFIGYDKNGEPICVEKKYKVTCDKAGPDCGKNGWVETFKLGGCYVFRRDIGGKKGKKERFLKLRCDKDKIECCRWKK